MSQIPLSPALAADLQQVDSVMTARIAARTPVLRVAGPRVLGPGAPRLRAALVLLSAVAGRYEFGRVAHAAAAVELINAATLVHDDLIDAGERRRGVAPSNERWDGDVGLMVGDYLFALASSEMALAPDSRVLAYYAQSVMAICEAQLAPVSRLAPLDVALEQYFTAAAGLTAALVSAACRAGAVCGGAADAQVAALGRYGHDLGLALRLAGDIADATGGTPPLGESATPGLDRGVITLPLIYAMARRPDPALASLLDQQPPDAEQLRWARAVIHETGALDQVRAEARRYAEQAIGALDAIAAEPRNTLTAIARAVAAG